MSYFGIPDVPAWSLPAATGTSAATLISCAAHAYFDGEMGRMVGSCKQRGQPGEFYANLPEEQKESLRTLTGADARNVRLDAIDFMLWPPRCVRHRAPWCRQCRE